MGWFSGTARPTTAHRYPQSQTERGRPPLLASVFVTVVGAPAGPVLIDQNIYWQPGLPVVGIVAGLQERLYLRPSQRWGACPQLLRHCTLRRA